VLRKFGLCILAAVILAGCDKPRQKDGNEVHISLPNTNAMVRTEAPPPPFVPPSDIVVTTNAPNAIFSLRHELTIAATHDSVAAHFQNGRDACLKDADLYCILTSASLTVSKTVSAHLDVALPHEKVALFEKRLLKDLPQDGSIVPKITSRSAISENETQANADVGRQLIQAEAYRDTLEALAKRPNLTVDETIKIHEELSQAQAAVESAEAAKHASDSHIRLEHLSISFEEITTPNNSSPFENFWKDAGAIFMASIADMLLRIVNALPWLPLATLLAFFATRAMRWVRRDHKRP
jgi:hypothetical protein